MFCPGSIVEYRGLPSITQLSSSASSIASHTSDENIGTAQYDSTHMATFSYLCGSSRRDRRMLGYTASGNLIGEALYVVVLCMKRRSWRKEASK